MAVSLRRGAGARLFHDCKALLTDEHGEPCRGDCIVGERISAQLANEIKSIVERSQHPVTEPLMAVFSPAIRTGSGTGRPHARLLA